MKERHRQNDEDFAVLHMHPLFTIDALDASSLLKGLFRISDFNFTLRKTLHLHPLVSSLDHLGHG